MDYSERLTTALNKLPNEIALIVSQDVDKRIADWLAIEGNNEDDPYIFQQVRYVENAVKVYEGGSN